MEYISAEETIIDRGVSRILCCQCAVPIEANPSNMCVACLRTHVDISDGIPKQANLHFCRGCERYLQPPADWVACTLESRELLALCLRKLKALGRVKLIDAGFAWTEPHSKRLKVKLTIQGEVVGGTVLQQTFIVEFNIQHQMCDACHRSEAQDFWRALVQVRQRADNRKSFYYLEQLILKHKAHENTLGIKPKHDGLDFFYTSENHARKMVDFLQSVLPVKHSHSKKLISHDIHSNIYNYKFTYSVEIAPVSKDSLVCLPKKLTHQLGSISSICLVLRVTSAIHLIDASTAQVADVSATVYWRQAFNTICNPKQLIEYIIMDIEILKEKEKKTFPGQGTLSNKHVIADAWVVKASDLGSDVSPVHTRTHLGHILKPGDTAMGYNLGDSNINDSNLDKLDKSILPDVFLVKKHYGDRAAHRRARNWKLKHMAEELHEDLDSNNDAYNDFLDDLEEDPALRQHVNIFKSATLTHVEPDDGEGIPHISLAEMLDDLTIDDVDMEEPDEIERLIGDSMRNTLPEEDVDKFRQLAEVLAMPNYIMRAGFEEYSAPRMTLTCLLCRSVFRTIVDEIRAGASDADITLMGSNLCVNLNIESENVCRGAVALNVPIIMYIVRQNPEFNPNTFCGLVFQSADVSSCPFQDERFEWEVTLPDVPEVPEQPDTRNDPPLKIALISDAHVDPLYESFGVGDCGEPTCCRVGQENVAENVYDVTYDDSFIGNSIYLRGGDVQVDLDIASDIKKVKAEALRNRTAARTAEPAGHWGDYRSCDTPYWATEDILEHISSNHDVDLVYYMGDTIDHGVWETSERLIKNINLYLADQLHKYFGDIPVLPIIGNHESQPTNQFAPSTITEPGLETQWLYDSLAEQWGFWLDEDAKATVKRGGYYTMLVKPGLRVIAINTNIAYTFNWWVTHDPRDALSHLQWLVDTLYAAELAGEKVHILSHIPPGVSDLTKVWTREYNKIISRFTSTITAEFNGHTHSDEFKVFYSNSDNSPINVAWNAGAMTSYTYYNVNYKILTVDSNSYVPQDIATYMYDLSEANKEPSQRPPWVQLYDFRDTYGVTDLSATQIDHLIHRMVTTEKDLLEKYVHYFHRLSPPRTSWGCDDSCKLHRICNTVVTELWERQKCDEITELFNTTP